MYKVGDKVKIYNKFIVAPGWAPNMDKYLGKVGRIIKNYDDGVFLVDFEDGNNWKFLEESFNNKREEKLKRILKDE